MTIKQINILLVFSCIVVGLLFLLNINTFYWADDYAFMNDLNKHDILQNCIYGYNNWDGRFLSLGAFVQGFLLKYVPVGFVTLFWTFCFLVSSMLIFPIISHEIDFKTTTKYQKILITILLAIVSWLGAYIHFSETIYWATGGVYSFSLLIGSIWVFCFLKIQKIQINLYSKIMFLIFSIIVGATTQNLTIALVTLTCIYLICNNVYKVQSSNLNFLLLLSLLLGLLFIMAAPGNYFRMGNSGFSELSFLKFFKNILFVLFHYLCYSIVAILISCMLSFGIFKMNNPNSKFEKFPKIQFPKNKIELAVFIFEFKWLLVTLSTILPFIFIPNLMAKRTVIFFIFFMIIFVLIFSIKTFKVIFVDSNNYINKNKYQESFFLFLIILILATLFISYNLQKGLILKKAILQRENLLNKSRGKTVYVDLIDSELTSPCYYFADYYLPKSDNYIKVSQELFYGVKIEIRK